MFNSKCNCGKCVVMWVAEILLVVGGLNWALVGLGMLMNGNYNLVTAIFGSMPTLEAIVYLLVGASAVVKLIGCRCAKCSSGCNTCAPTEKSM